ncbi:MAG: hypothetical protein OEX07_04040 [Gammaproteobacteria bacterium]|nr:hypothetical protein [Gammaproteobacteria bacterium]
MLKIRHLYHIVLFTGLTPLILVLGFFVYWLVSGTAQGSTGISTVIVFTAGSLLINLFFLFVYYNKARAQNNRQAINRTLFLIGLFLANVVTDIIVYNYVNFAATSNTIVFENKAKHVVKKLFFTNGSEKYFISPIEPAESVSRVLSFASSGAVSYTFDLKDKTYSGELIKAVENSQGHHFRFSIYRNGRVKIEEKPR